MAWPRRAVDAGPIVAGPCGAWPARLAPGLEESRDVDLTERIDHDLAQARRDRDQVRLSALGLLKSELQREAKAPRARAVSDQLVFDVVRREIKRHQESAAAFAGAGRAESAAQERAAAELLGAYLPAELSEQELEQELRAVIAEVRPRGPRDFGAVMHAARSRLGSRAQASRIAATARRLMDDGDGD